MQQLSLCSLQSLHQSSVYCGLSLAPGVETGWLLCYLQVITVHPTTFMFVTSTGSALAVIIVWVVPFLPV